MKYLRDNLPKEQIFFANGNILYPADLKRCQDEIACDAVMSAEGNLYNPGTFWTKNNDIDKQFPRVDKLLREYFEIVKENEKSIASKHAMKGHIFKLLHPFLEVHKELRPVIGKTSVHDSIESWEEIVVQVEKLVAEIYEKPDINKIDAVIDGTTEIWGGHYKKVPYWRCQPYFRRVDGVKQNTSFLKMAGQEELIASTSDAVKPTNKRGLEELEEEQEQDGDHDSVNKKQK